MKRAKLRASISLGLVGAMAVGLQIIGVGFTSAASSATNLSGTSKVLVGGDIHTLTVRGSSLYLTGHEHAAVSKDMGKTWTTMKSLDGADIMSWATNSTSTFAGGHIGLFVSPVNKNTFTKMMFYKSISDVHSIGASSKYVYLASPQFGLLVSENSGKTWAARNIRIGQGFMGSMLVDPKNPLTVLAPDMQSGLLKTTDGGKTWKALGGPMGTMAIAWNPTKITEIISIGMGSGGISKDGGATWKPISLPSNAYAVDYSADGKTLFVATLEAPYAHLYLSHDGGITWSTSLGASGKTKVTPAPMKSSSGMDPNMPGMAKTALLPHDESAQVSRPLSAVLGVFGLASTLVFSSAFVMRKRDLEKLAKKRAGRTAARQDSSAGSDGSAK